MFDRGSENTHKGIVKMVGDSNAMRSVDTLLMFIYALTLKLGGTSKRHDANSLSTQSLCRCRDESAHYAFQVVSRHRDVRPLVTPP